MSGWSSPFFRPNQDEWRREGTNTDLISFEDPFSWQDPPPTPRIPWSRTDLNNELSRNEQRHFGLDATEIVDSSASTPLPSYTSARASLSGSADDFQEDYMEQPSAFSMEQPPSQSTFLESYPKGNAMLTFQNDDDELETIHYVSVSIITERCPILGMAFEDSRSGPQLYLETLTSATALPFLRYLYTGSYALSGLSGDTADFYEDVPTSVLFHCQLYRLADLYDLPDLKSQAYVNVLRQCEFGCSSPDKPIDLCEAIRFAYEHLREHENLIDAIINYCVSCFLQHRLAEDEDFKKLAYELRPFHQDLCKNSMSRGFEDEAAIAIIQMPYEPYIPETYKSREDPATDVVFHFHSSDDFDNSPRKRKRLEPLSADKHEITLPLRTQTVCIDAIKEEMSSEDEEYRFGSKRRVSSVAEPSMPTWSGIAELRSAHSDLALSDSEYEIVEGPAPVEDTSDSDSDLITFVEVKHENLANDGPRPLPIHANEPTTVTAAVADAAENDSDSEWSLV